MMINSPPAARTDAVHMPLPLPPVQSMGGGNGEPPASAATFANMLRQNQAAPPPAPTAAPAAKATPDNAHAAHAPHDSSDAPAEAEAEAEPAGKPPAALRMRLKGTDKSPGTPRQTLPPVAADVTTATPLTATAADKPTGARPGATLDPALSAWLVAVQAAPPSVAAGEPPATGQPAASNPHNTRDLTLEGGAVATTLAAAAGGTDPRALSAEKAALDKASADQPAADAAFRIDLNLPTTSADGAPADKPSASTLPTERATDASVQFLNALTSAIATPREAAAAVALPARVDSPEFAPALATQVSLLTRDGVQRAELHLNPADMGPVSVQITMDGTKAQIDFGADVAATRHAIEAGLPELASALRDAGFTLAGGGVSQHSRGGKDGTAQGRGSAAVSGARVGRGIDPDTADNERAVTRRTVRLGGLDLYA